MSLHPATGAPIAEEAPRAASIPAPNLLRARDGGRQRVTFIELFFDLVSVFAVTQLAHYLLEHPDGSGLVEATLLLVAVWWAWLHTTWLTSYLDPDAPASGSC